MFPYGSGVAKKKTLPAEVQAHIDDLVGALAAITSGEPPDVDPGEAVENAIAAAYEVGAGEPDPWTVAVDIEDVAGDRMRRLRRDAGRTQEQLAAEMRTFGFRWHRQTVNQIEVDLAETEAGEIKRVRTLNAAEMLAIASLFGVPAVELMLPEPGEWIAVGDQQINGRQARELIIGRGGKVGTGGPHWGAAAALAPAGVERPARELWKRRRSAGKEG